LRTRWLANLYILTPYFAALGIHEVITACSSSHLSPALIVPTEAWPVEDRWPRLPKSVGDGTELASPR
jgi:hypothetical protein